jgi:disulfide oxidoreductase YuzD
MRILLLFLVSTFIWAKILIVSSYDQKDQCGIPQLNGFLSVLYKNGYTPKDFKIYFLDVRKSSKSEVLKKRDKILKELNKYDAVVVFDDAAFKLIGIPAIKAGKRVVFSGINYPYEKYKKEYNLKGDVGGVYEKLYAKEILTIFDKLKPINRIALFYSKGVGEIVKDQIKRELKNSKFENRVDYLLIITIDELKQKTKEVNNNPNITLFIPLALSLKDKNKKIPLYQFKDIYLKNIKKPDFGVNIAFTKLGFLGFGGVDFFKMGEQAGEIFIKHKKGVEDAKNFYIFINAKRAKEINFKIPDWFIRQYVKEIIW